MSLSYNYPPQMAYPSAPPVYRNFPAPPRLHWGIVFALSFVTVGFFGMAWLIVQSLWVKKITQNAKPFIWCLVYLLFIVLMYVCAIGVGVAAGLTEQSVALTHWIGIVQEITFLGGLVLHLVAVFTLRGALEAEPIDIPLAGFMTFFFGATYFQYHLFDYSVEGKVGEQLNGFVEAVAVAPIVAVNVPEVPPQA